MRINSAKAKRGGNRGQERTDRKRDEKGASSCREIDRQTGKSRTREWLLPFISSFPSDSVLPHIPFPGTQES